MVGHFLGIGREPECFIVKELTRKILTPSKLANKMSGKKNREMETVIYLSGAKAVVECLKMILAPIAERSFFQALLIADGSYWTFAIRPISGTLLLLTILIIALPPVLRKVRRRR